MTRIIASLRKSNAVLIVPLRVVRRLEMALYVQGIQRKFITWEITVQGDYRTYELAWYLVRRIALSNLNVHN